MRYTNRARRNWRTNWLGSLAAVLLLGILFLTQSRTAYVAVVAALALLCTLRWPRLAYALPVLLLLGWLP